MEKREKKSEENNNNNEDDDDDWGSAANDGGDAFSANKDMGSGENLFASNTSNANDSSNSAKEGLQKKSNKKMPNFESGNSCSSTFVPGRLSAEHLVNKEVNFET